MLNKHNLSIAQFATRDEGRYSLACIRVTPQETVATCGFILAKVTTPKLKVENFPAMPGVTPSTTFEPFNLPVDAARTIEKAIPKKTTIPILANVMVDGKATDATPKDGTLDCAVLAVNDLENPQVFRPRKDGGNFPAWEKVIPKREDAKFTLTLDARYLAKLATWVAKFADPRAPQLCIRYYGELDGVRFDAHSEDGQEFVGVIMPMRGEGN